MMSTILHKVDGLFRLRRGADGHRLNGWRPSRHEAHGEDTDTDEDQQYKPFHVHLVSESAINIPPMPYPCNRDNLLVVIYLIDHPVRANSQAPQITAAL
jgi:hypothetical protein